MKRFTAIALGVILLLGPSLALAQEPEMSTRDGRSLDFLTDQERAYLQRGEYTEEEMAASGLVGAVFGLGLGHAIQGRWQKKGWIFTLGEGGFIGLGIGGATKCNHKNHQLFGDPGDACEALFLGIGIVGTFAFKVFETIDVITYPRRWNRRVRQLKQKIENVSIGLSPNRDGGATATVALRF